MGSRLTNKSFLPLAYLASFACPGVVGRCCLRVHKRLLPFNRTCPLFLCLRILSGYSRQLFRTLSSTSLVLLVIPHPHQTGIVTFVVVNRRRNCLVIAVCSVISILFTTNRHRHKGTCLLSSHLYYSIRLIIFLHHLSSSALVYPDHCQQSS